MEPSALIRTVSVLRDRTAFSIRVLILLLSRLLHFFSHHIAHYFYSPHTSIMPPTVSSKSDAYISLRKSTFLDSYIKYDDVVMNANIEKCFYDPKLYALAVENADNALEQTWRRRILFENTPYGNILMYYNAYKNGFSYYSDSSNIPYFVLNAAIMKYVLLYRCRDFFLDDQITPADHPSPLLHTPDKSSTEHHPKQSNIHTGNNRAFAKLKKYPMVSTKTQPNTSGADHTMKEKQYTRNKVIYSGKMANATLLQNPTKKPSRLIFSSPLLDGLNANSSVQTQVFNYKDFKRLQETNALPLKQ